MTYVPQSAEYYHYTENAAGYYHITISKDHIDNPGDINTPEGWNWSFLINGADTWKYDVDNDGYAEIWDSHANLSFSNEDPDVVWAVMNMAEAGDYVSETVEQNATSCAQWNTFIPSPADLTNWSFDIWVAKSVDGGMTWSAPVNVTNTPGDFSNGSYDGPEEKHPHTPAFSSDDNVVIMYQVPNWAWNEMGDPTGADHMNYVYVGTVGENIDFEESEDSCSNVLSGDVTEDNVLDVLDIVSMISFIFGSLDFDDCQFEAGDVTQDGIINIADIVMSLSLIHI